MAKWRSAVCISLLLHLGILLLLSTLKAPKIKQSNLPGIKAYVVSTPIKAEATLVTVEKATVLKNDEPKVRDDIKAVAKRKILRKPTQPVKKFSSSLQIRLRSKK